MISYFSDQVKCIRFRHLKGEDITSLNYKELMALEDALENGLSGVREKKAIIFNILIIIYSFIIGLAKLKQEFNLRP